MAIIGNNADTLLNGLSDFWHRFFKDIGDIQAAYEGTEILLGQVYLDLLNDVLNTSVVETPLFEKQYYKLVTIREDQVSFRAGATLPEDRYVLTAETDFVELPELQNKVFNPSAALEDELDYVVKNHELLFLNDPTTPAPNGFANRVVDVICGGAFKSASAVPSWLTTGVKKGDILYTSPTDPNAVINATRMRVVHVTADRLAVAADTPIPAYPAGADPVDHAWRVVRLVEGVEVPVLSESGLVANLFDGRFAALPTIQVVEVSMWAVDAKVDRYALYTNFGHLFAREKRASTEAYRAFIRGLMQLYVFGPSIDRVESAMNVTANLPVIRTEDEVLTDYSDGLDATGTDGSIDAGGYFTTPTGVFVPADVGGYLTIRDAANAANIGTHRVVEYLNATTVRLVSESGAAFINEMVGTLPWEYSRSNVQTVTTSGGEYVYPRDIPMRDDIKVLANQGTLTFRAFEPLTTAIVVTDYIKDPEWWHNITLPPEVLPDRSVERRIISPRIFPNIIGSEGQAFIGDAGLYIGSADDTIAGEHGGAPGDPSRQNAGLHRQANFILMDQFLKMHLFAVTIHQSVDLTGVLINDLQTILRDLKPAHTHLYFSPLTSFRDEIEASEIFDAHAFLRILGGINVVDNALRVGSSWLVGQKWKYQNPTTGVVNIGTTATHIPVVIGGLDPSVLEPAASDGNYAGLIDRPLYAVASAAP